MQNSSIFFLNLFIVRELVDWQMLNNEALIIHLQVYLIEQLTGYAAFIINVVSRS